VSDARGKSNRVTSDWLHAPALQAVFSALCAHGHLTRAIGGAVRDGLRRADVHVHAADIDLATTARPEETIAAAKAAGLRAVPTGIEHGTITVISDHVAYEVTTLRTDVMTDGRHARVAFSNDWLADAQRRDFTVNAIYCNRDGTVFDPVGGLADLAANRLRFIGVADDRIKEDYLRILRLFRFIARLPDVDVLNDELTACARQRKGLRQLSAERIQNELFKIIAAQNSVHALTLMQGYGILSEALPTVPFPGRFASVSQMLGRTLGQTYDSMAQDPALRLFALAVAGGNDAHRLADGLKLSNAHRRNLIQLGKDYVRWPKPQATRRALRAALYEQAADRFARHQCYVCALHPDAIADGPNLRERLALARDWTPPVMPLSGRDLIALGISPGPAVGRELRRLETFWVESDFRLSRCELLAHAEAGLEHNSR